MMLHAVLSTAPNKSVEKPVKTSKSRTLSALTQDDTSPTATFSMRLTGEAFSCVSSIVLEPFYRKIIE